MRWILIATALGVAASCSEEVPGPGASPPDAAITFHRDIAPIVFESCSPCHHPGEAAPFSLLGYEDLHKRAKQIAIVTGDRFMPPWLPDSSVNSYAGDRSLEPGQIETIRRWVEAGAPEGDPADAPPTPHWTSEWMLGEPDLVVQTPDVYTVPAEGRDVYRNFVIPSPVLETRYVRAVEFRPDNRRVLHHAVLFVDGSGGARAMDRRDPEPGYPAMALGEARIPDGQFVGWTPGKPPPPGSDDVSWRLDPYTDIVIQMHLRPSGKPEPIQLSLGLHFADSPPTKHPMEIRLYSREIDIPAGDPAYVVESSYELPVDVQVLGVYPHAHYLGKDLQGYATLPDGTRKWLVHVPSWDFNWQEEYFYAEPMFLPRGTTLAIHYVYDNTSNNPLNPNDPPKRVVHGFESSDEMAELLLQVLPKEGDRPILWHDFVEKSREVDLARIERELVKTPEDASSHHWAAQYCLRLNRTAEAVEHYERLVELSPGQPNPLQRLGQARLADGDVEGALRDLQAALEIDPRNLRAIIGLGLAHLRLDRSQEAEQEFRRALEMDPVNAPANTFLGEILMDRGEREAAARCFTEALSRNPEHTRALWDLASLDLEQGKVDDAIRWCEQALHITPDLPEAHNVLGLAFEKRGDLERARLHFSLAHRFDPEVPAYEENLARVGSAREAGG